MKYEKDNLKDRFLDNHMLTFNVFIILCRETQDVSNH